MILLQATELSCLTEIYLNLMPSSSTLQPSQSVSSNRIFKYDIVCIIQCRYLYWTDVGNDRIEKASMDGTDRTVLHSTGLSTVYGLTLDYDNQILYWADYSNNQIEYSLTDGSNRTVLTSSGITDPFSITFFDGNLYWTDWSDHRIYTLSVDSPSTISQVTSNLGQDLYGIHVVTKQRQPLGTMSMHFQHMKDDILLSFSYQWLSEQ